VNDIKICKIHQYMFKHIYTVFQKKHLLSRNISNEKELRSLVPVQGLAIQSDQAYWLAISRYHSVRNHSCYQCL